MKWRHSRLLILKTGNSSRLFSNMLTMAVLLRPIQCSKEVAGTWTRLWYALNLTSFCRSNTRFQTCTLHRPTTTTTKMQFHQNSTVTELPSVMSLHSLTLMSWKMIGHRIGKLGSRSRRVDFRPSMAWVKLQPMRRLYSSAVTRVSQTLSKAWMQSWSKSSLAEQSAIETASSLIQCSIVRFPAKRALHRAGAAS